VKLFLVVLSLLALSSAEESVVEYERPFAASRLCAVVSDPSGGALEGAGIELLTLKDQRSRHDEARNQVPIAKVQSDSEGRFCFSQTKGAYRVVISKYGFKTLSLKVLLRKSAPGRLKLTLPLA